MYGILEALNIVATFVKDFFLFVNSQAALSSLISLATTDCDIVNKCLSVIGNTEESSASVHFTWVRQQLSQCGHEALVIFIYF